MNKIPLGSKYLSLQNTPHTLFYHIVPISSLEQVSQERNQDINQIIRSILFHIGNNVFIMVLISGQKQISWQKLRSYLKISRIRLATEKEVLDITGFQVGAVTPFATKINLRILADKAIFYYNEVSIGSGEKNIAIILKSQDLRRTLVTIEVNDFSEDELSL